MERATLVTEAEWKHYSVVEKIEMEVKPSKTEHVMEETEMEKIIKESEKVNKVEEMAVENITEETGTETENKVKEMAVENVTEEMETEKIMAETEMENIADSYQNHHNTRQMDSEMILYIL
jgi:hypothetical protein